ncbi:hypothetical protein KGQ34_02335, partial [Patescibacteria group bacterium]|nr:hypothetical protein [Patescibacteria group bacterium]
MTQKQTKTGGETMKKLGIGFAAILFFFVMAVFGNAFAVGGATVLSGDHKTLLSSDNEILPSSGGLYDNGFMNDVLTRRNPTPWNVVKHYVGNKPALIVQILKEQKISLDSSVKYPVGMAIRIP